MDVGLTLLVLWERFMNVKTTLFECQGCCMDVEMILFVFTGKLKSVCKANTRPNVEITLFECQERNINIEITYTRYVKCVLQVCIDENIYENPKSFDSTNMIFFDRSPILELTSESVI